MQHAELQPQRALVHLLGFSKPGPHFCAKPRSMQCWQATSATCALKDCASTTAIGLPHKHCVESAFGSTSGIAYTIAANASTKLLAGPRPPTRDSFMMLSATALPIYLLQGSASPALCDMIELGRVDTSARAGGIPFCCMWIYHVEFVHDDMQGCGRSGALSIYHNV